MVVVDIEEKLKDLISEMFSIDREVISLDEPLTQEGIGLNSIQMIELVVGIEEYFNVELDPEMFTDENFANIGNLSKLINQVSNDKID